MISKLSFTLSDNKNILVYRFENMIIKISVTLSNNKSNNTKKSSSSYVWEYVYANIKFNNIVQWLN